MKKSGDNLIHDLISEVISDSGGGHFELIFKKLNNEDKKKFSEIILQNKLSSNFIEFIGNNNLLYLFDKTFLENCENQKRRFQNIY